jgi:hypothetical protein
MAKAVHRITPRASTTEAAAACPVAQLANELATVVAASARIEDAERVDGAKSQTSNRLAVGFQRAPDRPHQMPEIRLKQAG